MKQLLVVLTLLLAGQGVAWAADCPPGTQLQLIGQFRGQGGTSAGTEVISTAGAQVRMLTVSCGGTACVSTLYDVDSNGDTNDNTGVAGFVDGNVRIEPGAAANTSTTLEFDPPLAFVDGINAHDDGNVNGIGAYGCR